MMRRIADPPIYQHLQPLQPLNQLCTIGAIGLGFTTLLFVVNVILTPPPWSQALANPWNANTSSGQSPSSRPR